MTTVEQLTLDLPALVEPDYTPSMSLTERFMAFHAANPHVLDALEALAAQWLARHPKVSVKALVERLRWESGISTTGDPYRLNNSWTAFYARLLVERRPQWADCIEFRLAHAVERPSTSAPGESIWGSPSPDKPLDYLPNPSREGVTPSARSSIPALPHHRGG